MTKPMIRIHDMETNEIIDREMNATEYEQYLKDVAIAETRITDALNKETAKEALLAKIGITADEAALLLG